jgi:hypothetical protein
VERLGISSAKYNLKAPNRDVRGNMAMSNTIQVKFSTFVVDITFGMGFRFRRQLRVAKGVYLNLGKTGTSLTIRGKHVSSNISKRGVRNTYHLTKGISYQTGASGCLVLALAFPATLGILWAAAHLG